MPKRSWTIDDRLRPAGCSAGDSADRQIAGHAVLVSAPDLDFAAFESDLGVVFHIEEIRVLQVGVAVRVAGPDLFRVDRHFDRRLTGVLRIEP